MKEDAICETLLVHFGKKEAFPMAFLEITKKQMGSLSKYSK
jgi:hypothetical protein